LSVWKPSFVTHDQERSPAVFSQRKQDEDSRRGSWSGGSLRYRPPKRTVALLEQIEVPASHTRYV
jgi:hypothetical protein